tara:strand:- start:702 stop:965 length:264 start_codon:yes stop_codon:yes gene_type:complete
MALKKQSIRSKHHITSEGKTVSKDTLIARSEDWNEIQENLFRKMLKQGGTFKVAGVKYKIEIEERNDLDSNRQAPVNLPPIPGERSF